MEQGGQGFSFCGSESTQFFLNFFLRAMLSNPVCYYKTFPTDLHLQMGATPVNFASTEDMIQNLAFVDNQLGKVWGAKSYLLLD